MLLLTTAALPQLDQHRHPNLGRLITPRHYPRLAETLESYLVAADNDCFQGLNPGAVCAMLEAIAPWPTVGTRIRHAWPWLSIPAELLPDEDLPEIHPNLLWIAVPDAVGDADATTERFPRMAHVAVPPGTARVRPAGRRGTARPSAVGGARGRGSVRRRQHAVEARARSRGARAPSPQTRTPGPHGTDLERENDPLRRVDRLHLVRQQPLLPLTRAAARRRARARQPAAAAAADPVIGRQMSAQGRSMPAGVPGNQLPPHRR
jgi:hypothetical protein